MSLPSSGLAHFGFVSSANPFYKLSWGEKCEGAEYPAQSNVPEEVKKAYANRGTD